MTEIVVNITSTSAAKGLREELDTEVKRRGRKFRPFIGEILKYAVENKLKFKKSLKESKEKGGSFIGAVVKSDVKKELIKWADENNTTLGLHCCFILEKVVEESMFEEIFQ
jgi:hypothetical protein